MELVPTLVNRLANTGLGLAPGVGFAVYAVEAGAARQRAAAVAAVLACAIVAVRGFRAGVRCEAGRLVVRGFVWTRSIPRSSVTEVTPFPAVRWTTPGGRRRWTPLWAFTEPTEGTRGAQSRKRTNTTRLRRWAAGG
ncbi:MULTISPECIES: hypothetical protein [unclassified Streptomyces]|uniref:hypothetical protein n=1 Tax=unclassified Streptomyces TaxID=2593676 RepID=UPI0006FDF279|nr:MULTISPECIES: hypothetical protein [unclassified Streptomyces]KQX53230.1 hypothetical protein ASD33_08520 [Streptomyces sp. Root1304]KRA90151.1 hypothetical protein ASE09_08525 [Streptomyces sp. Root66D1]